MYLNILRQYMLTQYNGLSMCFANISFKGLLLYLLATTSRPFEHLDAFIIRIAWSLSETYEGWVLFNIADLQFKFLVPFRNSYSGSVGRFPVDAVNDAFIVGK